MEYDEKIINRLKRIEGQIGGILKMMGEGKDCRAVVNQMTAARSALDRAAAIIVSTNLEATVREDINKNRNSDEIIKEAVSLLVKSR